MNCSRFIELGILFELLSNKSIRFQIIASFSSIKRQTKRMRVLLALSSVLAKKSSLKGNSNLPAGSSAQNSVDTFFVLSFDWWVLVAGALCGVLLILLGYAYNYNRNHTVPKGKST